jgi:hypothetical protein
VDGGDTDAGQADAGKDVRYVFVTSLPYDGMIDAENEVGPEKADEICQGLAERSSLSALHKRQWVAWLSTASQPAGMRISNGPLTVRYVRPNSSETVFAIGDDLRPIMPSTPIPTPRVAIDVTETGGRLTAKTLVWTGTLATGYPAAENCTGWRSSSPGSLGSLGVVNATNQEWTEAPVLGAERTCNLRRHLYCFQRP